MNIAFARYCLVVLTFCRLSSNKIANLGWRVSVRHNTRSPKVVGCRRLTVNVSVFDCVCIFIPHDADVKILALLCDRPGTQGQHCRINCFCDPLNGQNICRFIVLNDKDWRQWSAGSTAKFDNSHTEKHTRQHVNGWIVHLRVSVVHFDSRMLSADDSLTCVQCILHSKMWMTLFSCYHQHALYVVVGMCVSLVQGLVVDSNVIECY